MCAYISEFLDHLFANQYWISNGMSFWKRNNLLTKLFFIVQDRDCWNWLFLTKIIPSFMLKEAIFNLWFLDIIVLLICWLSYRISIWRSKWTVFKMMLNVCFRSFMPRKSDRINFSSFLLIFVLHTGVSYIFKLLLLLFISFD